MPSRKHDANRGYWGPLSHCLSIRVVGLEPTGTYIISFRPTPDRSNAANTSGWAGQDLFIYAVGALPMRIRYSDEKFWVFNPHSLTSLGKFSDLFDLIAAIKNHSKALTNPLPYKRSTVLGLRDQCILYEATLEKHRAAGRRIESNIENGAVTAGKVAAIVALVGPIAAVTAPIALVTAPLWLPEAIGMH